MHKLSMNTLSLYPARDQFKLVEQERERLTQRSNALGAKAQDNHLIPASSLG